MVCMNEELRAELLRRVAADQEARDAVDVEAMAAADGESLPWLRPVIARRLLLAAAGASFRVLPAAAGC
jgi:hypothetical protein